MDFRNSGDNPHCDDEEVIVIASGSIATLSAVDLAAWKDAVQSGAHFNRSATWQATAREQFKLRTKLNQLSSQSWSKYWAAWREGMKHYIIHQRAAKSQHN